MASKNKDDGYRDSIDTAAYECDQAKAGRPERSWADAIDARADQVEAEQLLPELSSAKRIRVVRHMRDTAEAKRRPVAEGLTWLRKRQ